MSERLRDAATLLRAGAAHVAGKPEATAADMRRVAAMGIGAMFMDPRLCEVLAAHLEDIAFRHSEGESVELMLHYDSDEECEECEEGAGHLVAVCDGCYPTYDGMDGHAVWPCAEFRSVTAVASAILGEAS
jgi:hypothetical protein